MEKHSSDSQGPNTLVATVRSLSLAPSFFREEQTPLWMGRGGRCLFNLHMNESEQLLWQAGRGWASEFFVELPGLEGDVEPCVWGCHQGKPVSVWVSIIPAFPGLRSRAVCS